MYTLGIIREFRTKQFTVRIEALEENDLDLSWDETGDVLKQLNNGDLVAFCAHAIVYYNGQTVGEDYLGNCIYKTISEFMDHKECGKQNKKLIRQGKPGRVGSYFTDMIHTVISEARKNLSRQPYIRSIKEKV